MLTVLLSSGLGFVTRGIETWMVELSRYWPAASRPEDMRVELWSGGALPATPLTPAGEPVICRNLHGLSRNHPLLARFSWAQRYLYEQWSLLPRTIWELRRRRVSLVYCGDPVLSWHLKRFQSWHGAKVVFMNGTRMGASWCNHMDGVHLLTEIYREEAATELAGHLRARFFVAPHFVDGSVFLPPAPQQRLALRRQWGIPEEAFVILTVGPFSQVGAKRLDHLASEVAAAPPCVLLHAGVREEDSAAFEEKLRSMLSNRLIVLGPVDRQKIVSLYQAADIYSLAALEEPFSIAILEAMACGLPVVHHPFPVTRWITGSGGASVSMQEPGAAAAVFRNLHQNPGLVEELSRAARHEAVSRFSPWEIARCIRQHLAIIAGAPNP